MAVDLLVVLIPVIGTVLGGLVAGGAVAAYLARPNRKKIEAETIKLAEDATATAVNTVTVALDRQDKTIVRQESEIERAHQQIEALAERMTTLEEALSAAGAAAALAAGRIVILRREVGRLGGDVEIGLREMGLEIAPGVEIAEGVIQPTDSTAEEDST